MSKSLLARISPLMLIVVTILLIVLVPFLSLWEEFLGAGVLCVILAVISRCGWSFWARFLKVSLPLVILSAFFNWILFLPGGLRTLWSGSLLKSAQHLDALWKALAIGGRFSLALYFSLLLVETCSHEELVWGLARLSDKLFRRPIIGEILALAVLSVPFFLDSLSRVRKWKELPKAVARVFRQAQLILSQPVEISKKKPGWLLLASSVILLILAVVIR